MLTYSFDSIGDNSLYEYLYKCIKQDILNGNLTPNDKLPSKRNFAKHLGVSTITVENAYAQLMVEGYIYSVPKKGFYVSKVYNFVNKIEHTGQRRGNVSSDSNDIIDVTKTNTKEYFFANFSSNQTDISSFPFATWAKLMREVLHENQQELITNSPSGGIYELREAIARHLKDFRGVEVSPKQIIIGAGTEYLYGLIIQLLGFDKKYGVENPGHRKIAQIYESHHVSCEHIAMDHSGILVDDLKKKNIDVIHISPSHHFPTGIIMPINRRYELLNWASEDERRYIIEDDYDSEYRLIGQPIPALQNIDTMEKVIYINTFTKTLASTIRISYMVLPMHLLDEFYDRLSFYSCTVSNFEQYTLARFIEEGYFEKHLNRMRTFYHGRRDALLQAIRNSLLSKKVTILEEDSGLHFLIRIQMDQTDEEFCKACMENEIKIVPVSDYYQSKKESAKHVFIINYSSILEENMDEAVDRIYQALMKMEMC